MHYVRGDGMSVRAGFMGVAHFMGNISVGVDFGPYFVDDQCVGGGVASMGEVEPKVSSLVKHHQLQYDFAPFSKAVK